MPPLLFALFLTLHIGGGAVAILAGAAAMTVRKGNRLHRRFGLAFVIAMLVMTSAATTMAVLLGEKSNVLAGLLAFYLVVSAWMAARLGDRRLGLLDYAGMLIPVGVSVLALSYGMRASANPHGLEGYRPVFYYVFAGLAGFVALLDLRVALRGSLTGLQRITRHLWRMSFAFFVASGSFFLGQQKVMPVAWHGSPILLALGLAPLALMIFWLIRVRLANWYKPAVAAT